MSFQTLIQQDVKRAQELRKEKKHEEAALKFEGVIKRLERELRMLRLDGTAREDSFCELPALLSQTYGSLAGNRRDAGRSDRKHYELAIKYYDAGNQHEAQRRADCSVKGLDTYNMLQRLVVRLLHNPALLGSEEECVDGTSMQRALSEVRREIDRQIDAGRKDSWALADRALVRFLCGLETNDRDLEWLTEGSADKSFYATSAKVVNDLLNEGLGSGSVLAQRLKEFEELLRRKGGLTLE